MSDQYVGEIRMFGGNFAPSGWAFCNGQLMSISEYDVLFSLIGTTYGGDGQTTFALPDLRGRVPIHLKSDYPLGAKGGSETVTLTSAQMPAHTHVPNANSSAGTLSDPTNAIWAASAHYSNDTGHLVAMNPQAISSVGGNQPHHNMMPSLTLSFIIALYGIYPQQQ